MVNDGEGLGVGRTIGFNERELFSGPAAIWGNDWPELNRFRVAWSPPFRVRSRDRESAPLFAPDGALSVRRDLFLKIRRSPSRARVVCII